MNNFPSRLMQKDERWEKQCPDCHKGLGGFIAPEYSLCDFHLVAKYAGKMTMRAGGACDHYENGYTTDQVAVMLRRALGETLVYINGSHRREMEK